MHTLSLWVGPTGHAKVIGTLGKVISRRPKVLDFSTPVFMTPGSGLAVVNHMGTQPAPQTAGEVAGQKPEVPPYLRSSHRSFGPPTNALLSFHWSAKKNLLDDVVLVARSGMCVFLSRSPWQRQNGAVMGSGKQCDVV